MQLGGLGLAIEFLAQASRLATALAQASSSLQVKMG